MDYGQPLLFGASINPSAGSSPGSSAASSPADAGPLAPVALAQRGEQLGLDLITVPDHLDDPQLHETWTLLSWIAGATSRIRLSPDLLNVPMRNPAVVARAAASLDLLAEGRVELALSAGDSSDALAAMGATRLTDDESATALEEAIEILSGLWDLSRPRGLHVRGTHHRVAGAERGPAPAHRIPLHLGGVQPRILELIGREADGWVLPSGPSGRGMLGLGMLAEGSRLIDESARATGRSPREIRRILHLDGLFREAGTASTGEPFDGRFDGPWEQWVEQLVPLIVDGGVSTVILAVEDATALENFATRVVPAVREAVADERHARGTDIGPIVPLHVRARRRAGIAYDRMPATLAAVAVEPGDVGYGAVRSTYLRGGAPGIVLRPRTSDEVSEAVTWAREQSVPLSVRSGGHGFSGRSTNDGGVVIDLSRMHDITVLDEQARRVRIEPGARWGDVAAALRPLGWAISSGDSGGVGVGGLATAGGVGYLGRAHGLTIDHVRAVELVLADGSLIRASADQHPELFWGMRGAGFAFGIVTAFELEADVVGDIGFGQLQHDVSDDVAGFLVRWGAAVEALPRDTTSFLLMAAQQDGGIIAQTMNVIDSDDPETIVERLQRLADTAPLIGQQASLIGYDALVSAGPRVGHSGYGEPTGRSGLLEHVTPEFAADAEHLLRRGATSFFQIRALGGATADVAPDATAFAHRSAQFSVLAMSSSPDRIDPIWDAMRRHFIGLYLSFETDQDPARLRDAFPPATLARLQQLKRQYDPDGVFRDNFDLTSERPAA